MYDNSSCSSSVSSIPCNNNKSSYINNVDSFMTTQNMQSSTPNFNSYSNNNILSPNQNKFKSSSLKQKNHFKLKNQSSPYYYHHNQSHNNQNNFISNPNTPESKFKFLGAHNSGSEDNLSTYSSSSGSCRSINRPTHNPPTTPISSLFSTPTESSSLNSSINKNEVKSNTSSSLNHPVVVNHVLFVTPVTSPSTQLSSESGSNQVSKPVSSAMSTYSRSSSQTSLNSFDLRSTHSSLYSQMTSSSSSNNGYITPGGYSDIPDSPSENTLFYSNMNSKIKNQDYSLSSQIESNPSKSNEITMIERTILATASAASSGKKAAPQQQQQYRFNQIDYEYKYNYQCQQDQYQDEEERVISYDMEGSIINGETNCCDAKSNISNLTFANEPTADLAFIRNLLESKKQIQENHQKMTLDNQNSFTPPVKLINNQNDETDYKFKTHLFLQQTQPVEQLIQINRALFEPDDGDKEESIKHYGDEEDKLSIASSMASVPSIVRNDFEKNLSEQSQATNNFSALFNKLKNNSSNNVSFNQTFTVDSVNQQVIQEEPEEQQKNNEEDDEKILFDFIDECYKKSNNQNLRYDQEEEEEEEYDDNQVEEQEDSEEELIINYTDNEDDLNPYQNQQLLNPKLRQELSCTLPKIVEEENESDISISISTKLVKQSNASLKKEPLNMNDIIKSKLKSKTSSLSAMSSCSSLSSLCSSNSTTDHSKPIVKLTKTALLRANKLKENSSSSRTSYVSKTTSNNLNNKIKATSSNQPRPSISNENKQTLSFLRSTCSSSAKAFNSNNKKPKSTSTNVLSSISNSTN